VDWNLNDGAVVNGLFSFHPFPQFTLAISRFAEIASAFVLNYARLARKIIIQPISIPCFCAVFSVKNNEEMNIAHCKLFRNFAPSKFKT